MATLPLSAEICSVAKESLKRIQILSKSIAHQTFLVLLKPIRFYLENESEDTTVQSSAIILLLCLPDRKDSIQDELLLLQHFAF